MHRTKIREGNEVFQSAGTSQKKIRQRNENQPQPTDEVDESSWNELVHIMVLPALGSCNYVCVCVYVCDVCCCALASA